VYQVRFYYTGVSRCTVNKTYSLETKVVETGAVLVYHIEFRLKRWVSLALIRQDGPKRALGHEKVFLKI